jgi:hypothetical protein
MRSAAGSHEVVVVAKMSKRRNKPARVLAALVTLLAVVLAAPPAANAQEADPIARGDAAFEGRFEIETMLEAIAAYEAALATLQSQPIETQRFVLNRLAQLYYERTTFTAGNTEEDRDAFEVGREYGLRSLRLNTEFAALEKDDFAAAVTAVTDPAALLWTADNWGGLLNSNPILGMLQLGQVRTLYARSLELDETYWGASAHNALGAMLVVTPALLGGDDEAGLEHLERAVEIAPAYLLNRVVRAQYWGFTYDLFGAIDGVRDAAFIEAELGFVLDAPIGKWPFWNREAKREAEVLLAELEEHSQ